MGELKKEWELDRYFYSGIDDVNIKKDIESWKKKCDEFIEKYKQKPISLLNESEFLVFLEESDGLDINAEKVGLYLFFMSSLDTQNQKIQKESTKLEKLYSEYSEKFLFIDEEYKKIGFEKLMEWSKLDMMKSYKNDFVVCANDIKYLLSEPEERIYLKLFTASSMNLHEELTTSFDFNLKDEKLTEDEVRTLRESQDRETRKEAFKCLADVYLNKQNQVVLGNLYSLVCKENVADIELRGYNSVLSSRNISEELSDETVEFLLKTITSNYDIFHSFLEKKTKLLGLDKMEVFDVFAPYPSKEEEKKFSFEEGWKLYKDTLGLVDPVLDKFSDEMIEGGRISVYPKQGKSTGAYAQYTKDFPEFVLLNWADTPNDVTTLAHEMGHVFHGHLSKIQKAAVYDTPLTLAETASIFNETLMFETLIDTIESEEQKKKLICSRLDDIFGTIFRQVAYVSFEKRCHESFKNNEPLTFDDYNEMWAEEMENLYGPSVSQNREMIKYGWSAISHIFGTPFYCYTYAFGNIISLNLYQKYKTTHNKEEFIEKYHQLLAAGGSDSPENLLHNIFGIKFDEEFYNLAFENIKELINKL